MVIKALGQENASVAAILNFSDVPSTHWAFANIQRAVNFDLIKGLPDGRFLPNEFVSKAQAIAVVMSSLKTEDMTFEEAQQILEANYDDAKDVQSWVTVFAGKAAKMGVIVGIPGSERLIQTSRPIKRGELAAYLYKMIELTKVTPNEKVGEALKRTADDGFVIDNVTVDGIWAIIPAGTVIPIKVNHTLSTQKVFVPQEMTGVLDQNIITYDHYLLLEQGDHILGNILDFKKAFFFIRNGKMVIETRAIRTEFPQTAQFCGISDNEPFYKGFWSRFFRAIFKGAKVEIKKGDLINVKLLKAIKINLTTGEIIDYEQSSK